MENRFEGNLQTGDNGLGFGVNSSFHIPFSQLERKNIIIAIILFGVTIVFCTFAGYMWDVSFRISSTGHIFYQREIFHDPLVILRGIPYCLAIMFILLCHEMGHFFACRYYRIHCTLPFIIPFPVIPLLPVIQPFGTMGAFIKIKEPIRNRKQLFDIGVAGPLAGMAAALPIFIAGLVLSKTSVIEPRGMTDFVIFGDSLLTWALAKAFSFDPNTLALHPLCWAAWFGFFATSINLFPIGQLDGGHVVYAAFGPKWHNRISNIFHGLLIGVSLFSLPSSLGYIPFAVLLLLLQRWLKHSSTLDDYTELDPTRKRLVFLMLLIILLTFIPVPIQQFTAE